MRDVIFEGFLKQQYDEGMTLAANSSLLELTPVSPQHFIVGFHCKGLVKTEAGQIEEAEDFRVGIYFGSGHLRRLEPAQLVTWFVPASVWHPNIRAPFVCVGHMNAGVGLVPLIYQLYEIVTWQRYSVHDSMNPDAAQWARNNPRRFPVDDRPLRGRTLNLTVKEATP
jgi:hypothetical protein